MDNIDCFVSAMLHIYNKHEFCEQHYAFIFWVHSTSINMNFVNNTMLLYFDCTQHLSSMKATYHMQSLCAHVMWEDISFKSSGFIKLLQSVHLGLETVKLVVPLTFMQILEFNWIKLSMISWFWVWFHGLWTTAYVFPFPFLYEIIAQMVLTQAFKNSGEPDHLLQYLH